MLARWLPGASIALTPAASGASTPVWRVEARVPDDPTATTFFLRLGETPDERRDGEVRVHQLLREAGVRVPEIIAWEGRPPELDRAATLTSAIAGEPLATTVANDGIDATIAAEAGRDLARIGGVAVRGYGWIAMPDPATGTLRAEEATRGAWVAEFDAALDAIIAAGLIAPDRESALRRTYDAWRTSAPDSGTTSALAHGDFDSSHLYAATDPGAAAPVYTGIIDFGEGRGADPLYDLGHALLHDGEAGTPSIFPALLAGYRAVQPLDDAVMPAIRAQAVAIAIRQLAIAHRRGSPYAATLTARIGALLDETPV